MTISQCRVFIPFLLLLNSCATDNSLRQSLPAEVSMNPDAGRGNWLLITLQLQNGQDLPFICTSDLKELPFLSGHPAKGILGMDLLRHYCVQLDFEAGMIRFLNSNELDVATLGKAFPLTFLSKGNI